MAATEADVAKDLSAATSSAELAPVDNLADSFADTNLEDKSSPAEEKDPAAPRELHVYTRAQVLLLSKSPLVKPPDGLPALKDWFGDWNEQQTASKKEGDSSNSTSTRDRRFRRDAEEGDSPARPSFRSSLSQPSQMGNFRHQSLRTADRDRDSERERARDERDREGQERLRNLSDKYDRERLALTSATSALRNKERDSAPHLATGNGRSGTAATTTGTRRNEAREPAKKKPGEASDDWRRGGAETTRTNRDDRTETGRRDRDRPRSRVRDTSRTRRDPSTSRRDRDTKERDRSRRRDDRDRDDYHRRDWDDHPRDRDDGYRDRDRYDYGRRDADRDRDGEEDPRRWRDDGKRDERIANRRDRNGDRDRDRERGWDHWEPSERDRDRDGEGRNRRGAGRDRRGGNAADDAKEERKEREKEKEPAWMETYVPTTPSAGILGGQSVDGELDGIQAWKKNMKEKEKREKEGGAPTEKKAATPTETAPAGTGASGSGSNLDEIQLFKLMMKAAKKEESGPTGTPPNGATPTLPGHASPKKDGLTSVSSANLPGTLSNSETLAPSSTSATSDGKVLSLFTASAGDPIVAPSSKHTAPSAPSLDHVPAVSRLFPTPPGLSPSTSNTERPSESATSSYPNTPFDPPAGSRLLALASRAQPPHAQLQQKVQSPAEPGLSQFNHIGQAGPAGPAPQRLGGITPNSGMSANNLAMLQSHEMLPNLGGEPHFPHNARATPSERSARSFSPFGQSQAQFVEDNQETMRISQAELLRRAAMAERGLAMGPESPSAYEMGGPLGPNANNFDLGGNLMGGAAGSAKGSRFMKFFDNKNREPQGPAGLRKASGGSTGFAAPAPLPGQRHDIMLQNGMGGHPAEGGTMEDIFAMLQNSSRNHRASPQPSQTGRISAANGPFGQPPIDLPLLQQQHLQQLHQAQQQQQFAQHHNARLVNDSLYDSRMEDRNFVPDGMVPGLRLAPRPRSREPSGPHFNEQFDEPLHVNVPRLPQQQRALEQMYAAGGGPHPSLLNQQANLGRNVGIPVQQQNQFRGGPGIPPQALQQGPPQRIPPGLANLGGRPPHDAQQYLAAQLNAPGPLHGGPQQPGFNNIGGFNGPLNRPPIGGPHHPNALAANQLGNMGPGNMDLPLRGGPNQAALLGLGAGGLGGVNGGLNGGPRGGGGFNPQQVQLQAQQMALRQQQQHQQQHTLQPHMMPHMQLPPHLQQQQQPNLHPSSQGTQDLMALLMGGQRE